MSACHDCRLLEYAHDERDRRDRAPVIGDPARASLRLAPMEVGPFGPRAGPLGSRPAVRNGEDAGIKTNPRRSGQQAQEARDDGRRLDDTDR